MTTLPVSLRLPALLALITLVGCSRNESASSTASSTPAAPAPAAGQSPGAADPQAPAVAPRIALTEIKVPDLKATPASELARVASQAISSLAAHTTPEQAEVRDQAAAIVTSISSDQAVDALAKLKDLAAAAQSVPGADAVVEKAKQMVSAWALKQGFDTAKISPVLGALQQGDYAGLASQAAKLLGAGGLNDQQKALVSGVLSTFGLDAQADEAINKVKGLFGQ